MRMPAQSFAVGLLLVRSVFLLSRLNSNAKARALIAGFQPLHDALEAANDAKRKADNAELFARGPVVEIDQLVAVFLTIFQLDVLKVVAKNYDDPLYVAIFPKGLKELRKLHGQALLDELMRIALRLKELGTAHPLAAHLPALAAFAKDYAAPLKTLKAAADAQDAADVALSHAKKVWRAAYDGIAGSLRALFAGRKTYQESFFYPEPTSHAVKPAAQATPKTE